jgi:hypothetical protein
MNIVKFEKKFFNIGELSVRWECSVEEILRRGESGDLILMYDWKFLEDDIEQNDLPVKMLFEFKNHHLAKVDRDFLSSFTPEMYECETDRMLALTKYDLWKIIANGQVGISYGYCREESLVMSMAPTLDWDKIEYPVLKWADILILSKSVEKYEKLFPLQCGILKKITHQNNHVDPAIDSTKENASLYKTIGLLSQALIDSGSKNLMKGDEPNYSAMARKLECYIPIDPMGMKESHGLSERSLRERLKKGRDSLVI